MDLVRIEKERKRQIYSIYGDINTLKEWAERHNVRYDREDNKSKIIERIINSPYQISANEYKNLNLHGQRTKRKKNYNLIGTLDLLKQWAIMHGLNVNGIHDKDAIIELLIDTEPPLSTTEFKKFVEKTKKYNTYNTLGTLNSLKDWAWYKGIHNIRAIRDKETVINILLDTKPELSIPEFEQYIRARNMFPGDIDDDDEDEEDNTLETFQQDFIGSNDNSVETFKQYDSSSDCYSGDSVPLISFKPKENKHPKRSIHDNIEESYNDDHHSSMAVIDIKNDSSDSYDDDHHSSIAVIDLESNKKKNAQQKRALSNDSLKQHVLYDSSDSNDRSEMYKKHKR